MVGVGVASGASGGGRWASEASGGGVSPSEARLPPVGLASSRRRRRIASFDIIVDDTKGVPKFSRRFGDKSYNYCAT